MREWDVRWIELLKKSRPRPDVAKLALEAVPCWLWNGNSRIGDKFNLAEGRNRVLAPVFFHRTYPPLLFESRSLFSNEMEYHIVETASHPAKTLLRNIVHPMMLEGIVSFSNAE